MSPAKKNSLGARIAAVIALVREGLSGDEDNAASGPLSRAIPLLAIPMVLEMAMEALFAICDVFFVARIGASAVATVGLTESMMSLVYAVAFGLSMPAGAMVARRIGEGDALGASKTGAQGIWLGLIVGGAMAVSAAFSATLLVWMGAEPDVVQVGTGFTTLSLLTSPVIVLIFVNGGVFRGAGDARRAMRAVWIANAINIVLDPCLIFGLGPFPELGVTGAAVATTIGRTTGVLYQLAHLWKGPLIRLVDAPGFDREIAYKLWRRSLGGTVQHLVETGSWIAMVRIVAEFGSSAIAAFTVTTRIIMFTLLPVWGFSNATATLVGQSLGKKDEARAERSVWLSGLYCTPFLALATLVFMVAPDAVAGLFTDDPGVRDTAAQGLFVVGFGYVFYGWQMVTQQAFNGAGDTSTPARINVACFWLVQIPLAWVLARQVGMGTVGVFASAAICYSLAALVGVVLVKRGSWKHVVV